MKQNVSKRLEKIEGELAVDGTELIVAMSWREKKEAEEKVRRFEEENPGMPVPYQIMAIQFVEAKDGKGTGWVGMRGDDGKMEYVYRSEYDNRPEYDDPKPTD